MSQFVDECRREWRRLGVPDPIANEMAADLTADLEEAEAEGGSAEDVLGNSAFDPRRFAAAWAAARGVTGPPPPPTRPPFWRPPIAIALTAFLGALIVGAVLILLVGRGSSSIAIASRRIIAGPGPIRLLPPVPGRFVVPGRPFVGTQIANVVGHPLVLILLMLGIAGVVVLGLLAVLYWSPWFSRRYRRHEGGHGPSWS